MNLPTESDFHMQQTPLPGTHLMMFRGDIQSFTLTLPQKEKGKAWIRTNIGHAALARDEIVQEVDKGAARLGRDWFDIPMIRTGDRTFRITLPLSEVGHFEAKCFFLKEDSNTPVWPPGENVSVNVAGADQCCANIVYNTFVRQFGPNKHHPAHPSDAEEAQIRQLDQEGWTVIPPSGTFRDVIKELDFIIGTLGCRYLQLLPIHPTPTTYARMGRFGSPYASLSFTAVDPALAEFDPKATPLEQFIELVDRVHAMRARIIIDVAINHTGWAADLHESRPQWLARDEEGRIEVPGAWGVSWEDLTRLDYTHKDLWQYMADVFLTWCRRGVDGFRCDAGYMIPLSAWKYIVALVREQYPDTLFLLEGLGGKMSATRDILDLANFDWAYSELFQNYDRFQIENYLPEAIRISKGRGLMVHFAETHDNDRLAARSQAYARMRTALSALCSVNGAFAFAGGVEWFATEKINVHQASSLNWGASPNQVEEIRRLTAILKTHPAFHDRTDLALLPQNGDKQIALMRKHLDTGKQLLVLVNLSEERPAEVSWEDTCFGPEQSEFTNLLDGRTFHPGHANGRMTLLLDPCQVLCLTRDPGDAGLIERALEKNTLLPDRTRQQQLQAKALDIFCFFHGTKDLGDFHPDPAGKRVAQDPIGFCRELNPWSDESRVILWQWPSDAKREVMVPPGHFLMVRADAPFQARLMDKDQAKANEMSLPCDDGSEFVLFSPLAAPGRFNPLTLKLTLSNNGTCTHAEGRVLFLPIFDGASLQTAFSRAEILSRRLHFMGTNDRGSLMRANVSWGRLHSRYDALLAANLNPELPEDRWVMLTRCRAWLVFQAYSQEISDECIDSFEFDCNGCGTWRYRVPCGQGECIFLLIQMNMVKDKNTIQIRFSRCGSEGAAGLLADHKPIRLILRPDMESRNCHDITKAYQGPEHAWPQAVQAQKRGFTFSPEPDHRLDVRLSQGSFVWEPEWEYMVHRSQDKKRGQDPSSDLFSPGYLFSELKGDDTVTLTAWTAPPPGGDPPALPDSFSGTRLDKKSGQAPGRAPEQAMDDFIVKRGNFKTVIAGYPWFLDWGRDSLIFTRGLISTGRTGEARDILKQFGRFEQNGTLPNVIYGNDAGNRDTSDAPLWFVVACGDLINFEKTDDFLEEACGQRTIRQIIESIADAVISGTPGHVRMDPESCLVFSPCHFSWMDTNYPAGSPREGYPIEIQALWYRSLSIMARISSLKEGRKWDQRAGKVRASIRDLFQLETKGYLSDCLHCGMGIPAGKAEKDDALRPNQLFAVTLDAVTDSKTRMGIVESCQELLVPGAIRSLADRAVSRPIDIMHNGIRLNDPLHPYQGTYTGDEDTQRKPAYHNGTAWTWVFPSFCEAWAKTFGRKGAETALAWLGSSMSVINEGCIGQVPEILDGDFPHLQRGCDAQAWGVSEFLRVWKVLTAVVENK